MTKLTNKKNYSTKPKDILLVRVATGILILMGILIVLAYQTVKLSEMDFYFNLIGLLFILFFIFAAIINDYFTEDMKRKKGN